MYALGYLEPREYVPILCWELDLPMRLAWIIPRIIFQLDIYELMTEEF